MQWCTHSDNGVQLGDVAVLGVEDLLHDLLPMAAHFGGCRFRGREKATSVTMPSLSDTLLSMTITGATLNFKTPLTNM